MIAYLFPPFANSGTRRSLEFANLLPEFGWEPVVLSVLNVPKGALDLSLLQEVRPGTRVERAANGADKIAERLTAPIRSASARARFSAALSWRLKALLKVPDETAWWYSQAVRRGVAVHRESPIDVIYASGWPWTSFLVAHSLARKIGVPYVLDYRDLWESTKTVAWENHGTLANSLQPRIEAYVARSAAAIVTTTESFASRLKGHLKHRRVVCITNGFNPADFGSLSSEEKDSRFTTLAYTGVWRNGYNPEDLYRAINQLRALREVNLERLRILTAGYPPGAAKRYGLDDVIQEHGQVPHATALKMMNSADALYLPVSGGYYASASLPGKLFEYLGCGNRIIASAEDDSEVARVLTEVGGSVRVKPGDIDHLASTVERLLDGSLDFPTRRTDEVQRFTRQQTTERLAAVLDEVHRRD